jgi:hypothetical protein
VAYHTYDRWGNCESNTSVENMRALLEQLDLEDEEHTNVSLTHESEWCLGAYEGGLLVWENLESGEPRHMYPIERERVLELWLALSEGQLETVEKEAWLPGYGN